MSADPTAVPAVAVSAIRPVPTDEEAAAIVAAVEAAWPRPMLVDAARQRDPNAWRFSGRWWARPVAVRRARPWIGALS